MTSWFYEWEKACVFWKQRVQSVGDKSILHEGLEGLREDLRDGSTTWGLDGLEVLSKVFASILGST